MPCSRARWTFLLVLVLAGAEEHEPGPASSHLYGQRAACEGLQTGRCEAYDGSNIRRAAAVPEGGRLLVLYQYYETPKAAENLRYFLAKTVYEPAQQQGNTRSQGVDGDDQGEEGGAVNCLLHSVSLRLQSDDCYHRWGILAGAYKNDLCATSQENVMMHTRKESIMSSS